MLNMINFAGYELPRVNYDEIFYKDIYKLKYLKNNNFNPKIVWDIGANIGLFSRAINILWPDTIVHSWEPHPKLHQYFEQNAPQAILHKSAAWNRKTNLELVCSLHKNAGGSFLKNLKNNLGDNYIKFKIINSYICSTEIPWENAPHPDFIKFDCEGSEYSLLKDLKARPRYIFIEFHHKDPKYLTVEYATKLRPEYKWVYTQRNNKIRSMVFGELI